MKEYEVKETFLRVTRRVPGVLCEPAGRDDECLNTVLVMHSDEDYLDVPTGRQLARRGFRVLCANMMVKEGLFFTQVEKMQAGEGRYTDDEPLVIPGANHKFHTAHHCEAFRGQFGDAMETLHDYVAKWLSAGRFDGPSRFQ